MELNIGNVLKHKNNRMRYKIIDVFYYKGTTYRGYILKDT